MRVDVMVDIETLGKSSHSTIFQISAIAFDMEDGGTYSEFNQIADIEQNKLPLHVDGSTLKWWLDTDADLLRKLLHKGNLSSYDILYNFKMWLLVLQEEYGKENVFLWGNGIIFDNKMIQHQLDSIGEEYPIYYRNDRDVRTLMELACKKTGMTEKQVKSQVDTTGLTPHDAYDDVVRQIRQVRHYYKLIVQS